jgi:hypothetical protein
MTRLVVTRTGGFRRCFRRDGATTAMDEAGRAIGVGLW